MERWLRKQPREVAVAFAARAALRVLPILQGAQGQSFKGDFFAGIVLPVFRATCVVWTAAKYPAQPRELKAFGLTAASDAAKHAYVAAAVDRNAPNAADAIAHAADDYAARFATGTNPARVVDEFWSAVSIDAMHVEAGETASVLASSPLWPEGQPDRLGSLWQEMKAALHAEKKQDWQVWTNWYDDRLVGHVRDEGRELAYVQIEDALWDQGPAIVNAEIKRRIEKHEPLNDGATAPP